MYNTNLDILVPFYTQSLCKNLALLAGFNKI